MRQIEAITMLRIRETIKKYGLTQTEVAKRLGISVMGLYAIINTNNPRYQTLVKIAEIIGCDVRELIDGQKEDGSLVFTCPDCGAKFRIEKISDHKSEEEA